MATLGIDIGGTGIKGALVDTAKGELVTERERIKTPHPARPENVADVVAEIASGLGHSGPIGCTFPAVIAGGVVSTAANVDESWIGTHAADVFSEKTGCPVTILNDADAAGIAEMAHGAGKDRRGTVLMLTLGTGIGSALFIDDVLVPNTELGHLEVRGKDAEKRAANSVREKKGWKWKKYAKRLDEVLHTYEHLLAPDLFVIGGGISKKAQKYVPRLTVDADIVPAELRNQAGIVGAAMAAERNC